MQDKSSGHTERSQKSGASSATGIFDRRLLQQRIQRAVKMAVPGADFLLAYAAQDLEERLSTIERSFPLAVDLSGYNGLGAEILARSGKVQNIVRIEQDTRLLNGHDLSVIADAEYLPLAAQSTDLLISLLSLQLTNDTPGAMIQIRQALKPDGLFLGAMIGAGTLGELRESLLQAEAELTGGVTPRVAPFADIRDVGGLLQRAGFALPVTDIENLTVRYDSLFDLMKDLRAMGMQNPLLERSRKPVSRQFFMRAAQIYAERFSDPDGRIRATFSIIWLSGWAPHESQQKPLRPGSAKTSLAEALGQLDH